MCHGLDSSDSMTDFRMESPRVRCDRRAEKVGPEWLGFDFASAGSGLWVSLLSLLIFLRGEDGLCFPLPILFRVHGSGDNMDSSAE